MRAQTVIYWLGFVTILIIWMTIQENLMQNTCPECGEYIICDTCQRLFDEEAWVLALESDIERQAMAEIQRINISSGEDVCLA